MTQSNENSNPVHDRVDVDLRRKAFVLEALFFLGVLVLGTFTLSYFAVLLNLALLVVYGILEASTGAAFGKYFFGIRIKSADGGDAPFSRLIWRALIKFNGVVLCFVTFLLSRSLDLRWISELMSVDIEVLPVVVLYGGQVAMILGSLLACGERKQTLHDRLAGTAVYPRD